MNLQRIYKKLDESEIILKKIHNKKIHAYTDLVDSYVVDPRKDFISSIIHEILHLIYPYKCETYINRLERKYMNSITTKQIKHLLIKIANKL